MSEPISLFDDFPSFNTGKSQVLKRLPVAYLVCNQSPPGVDGTPSLMTFREVETLFHEVNKVWTDNIRNNQFIVNSN